MVTATQSGAVVVLRFPCESVVPLITLDSQRQHQSFPLVLSIASTPTGEPERNSCTPPVTAEDLNTSHVPSFTRTEYMHVQILLGRLWGVQLGTQEGRMPIRPLYFGPLCFHPQAGRVGIHTIFSNQTASLIIHIGLSAASISTLLRTSSGIL
jgi:hypothetical protein